MGDSSGERPKPPLPRPASAEHVLVPKRVLFELYDLNLDMCEVVEASARLRVDANRIKMRVEEVLTRYAPGLVLEVSAARIAREKTPVEVPRPDDLDKSRGSQGPGERQ